MNRYAIAVMLVSALAPAGNAPKPHLREPEYLPPMARQLLRSRMERHGDDMVRLVLGVTLLQRDVVKVLAKEISNEPRLTRSIAGGGGDLNAALPNRFFVLQDELRSRATALADAANKPSDAALASALGKVMETCVACHSAYLNPEPD